jgi:hypothetical protein
MNVVNKETATREVESWLDFKKVGAKRRETYKENIDTLVSSIEEGVLSLSENKEFIHELKFALNGEVPISTLKYKPRITVESVQMHMQGVKSSDLQGMICAYVAALTTQPKGVIKHLDTEDQSIAQSIAIFFL